MLNRGEKKEEWFQCLPPDIVKVKIIELVD